MKVNIKNYPNPDGVLFKMGVNTEQGISVKIDEWDTFNMDVTLAHIIHPMLVQLRKSETKGVPVLLEDILDAPIQYKTDEECWDWILGEMIFAFKSKLYDWEAEFTTGKWDMQMSDIDKPGKVEMTEGPEHTYQVDKEGMQKYRDRVENGYRLFGKYYDHLWE